MSLLSHFLRSIRSPCMWASPSTLPWLWGRLAMLCQGVLLAMWVLWSVTFVCLRDFTLAGPAPFHHLVTALPCALPIRLRCPPPIPPSLSSSPRIRLVSPPGFCLWSLSGRYSLHLRFLWILSFWWGSLSSPPGASVFAFPQVAPVHSCCGFSEFIHLILLSWVPR